MFYLSLAKMSVKKPKYYVVISGHNPGIYNSWSECQKQINGFSKPIYKSFESRNEAEKVFKEGVIPKSNRKKDKYYVVWNGHRPGIYESWDEAKKQLTNFKGAQYKSFGSRKIAQEAFVGNPADYYGKDLRKVKDLSKEELDKIGSPLELSLSVDAACNAKSGKFEYQAVWVHNNDQAFHFGPMMHGTNNVGEFLGLVHSLAFLQGLKLYDYPIYTDSKIAMAWVRNKRAKTTSKDPKIQQLLIRAEKWLHENTWKNPILKWETKAWGEIPADFGRK